MSGNPQQKTPRQICFVYIGTYTDRGSQGIYRCQLDITTGELGQVSLAANVDDPSYLAIDVERRRLYAVNERVNAGAESSGRVSAFAVQPSTGELSFINRLSSFGGAPCYLTLDHRGRYVLVANYMGGSIVVFPVGQDGALGTPTDEVVHSGSSLIPERQEVPHPHAVVLDSPNNNLFVPDLGTDRVMQYRFEPDTGQVRANRQPWIALEPGSGPRHMVFHPNLKLAYVINELSSTITALTYDSKLGVLEPFQTISTVPQAYSGTNIAADLHVAPNGRFLYGSNRGHDSIAIYSIDQNTGSLTHLNYTSTLGMTPRGFAIEPGGTFILVANQDSDNIVTFRIDDERGAMVPTGYNLHVPSPVCLKFLSTRAT